MSRLTPSFNYTVSLSVRRPIDGPDNQFNAGAGVALWPLPSCATLYYRELKPPPFSSLFPDYQTTRRPVR